MGEGVEWGGDGVGRGGGVGRVSGVGEGVEWAGMEWARGGVGSVGGVDKEVEWERWVKVGGIEVAGRA